MPQLALPKASQCGHYDMYQVANKRMAHLCCERKNKCLAYRSQRRHHVMCPVVKADACNNMNQLCGDEGWLCQKQAGVGIVACARLQEQPHVRASIAVSRENVAVARTMPAHFDMCQVARAIACNSMPKFC